MRDVAKDWAKQVVGQLEEIGLAVRPTAEDGRATGVIESDTMELTTQVKRLITGVGGATVVTGGLSGAWAGIADNTPLVIAIVAGVAVVLAALVFGLAKVVNGDVEGRAAATAAQKQALGLVAKAQIEAGSTASTTMEDGLRRAVAAFAAPSLQVTTENGTEEVEGVSWSATGDPRLRLASGDIVDLDEVRAFTTGSPERP